ncbi:SHOCT domain-containing protein [Haloferax sp. YSSS75]|uniref:SHOCT domain-containing protein n=1 Tax=Haloferax sp. YSSS75 TaxID=3388564 RepID=UPI00398CEAC2
MNSLETLRERGVGGYVHDHPWQFAILIGVVGAALAVSNGVNPFPAFVGMFLVGAVLGLGYSYVMDFLSGRLSWEGTEQSAPVEDVDPEAALHTLRERYADGELSDAEFETKIQRLLETESVDSAREYASRRDTGLEREEA